MEIHDPRSVADFQKTTFCGHQRPHVVKVLKENIQLGHADYSCYWTLEFLSSGLVHSLWATFFEAAALHINRAQPSVFLYLTDAFEKYAALESNYGISDMTSIRNNLDARRMVCETAAILALCRKNKMPALPTMKPTHDFDPVTIQESLLAPSQLYGRVVLKREDPMAAAVPINELAYATRPDVRNTVKAFYWMAWLIAYCKEHKKLTKQNVLFADRSDEYVRGEDGRHVVWIFWDVIRRNTQAHARPYIDAIYKLYTLRWSPSTVKQKQPLLLTAILLLCEGTTLDTTPVATNTLTISNVLAGIPGWIDAIIRTQKSFSN